MRRAQDRARSAKRAAHEARDENVPAKRADFFFYEELMPTYMS